MAHVRVPITPSVLRWMIEESGYSVRLVAKESGVSVKDLNAWLAGKEQPGLTAARDLARVLNRPLAALMLPEPPTHEGPVVKLRAPPGAKREHQLPEERKRVREVARLQEAVAWVQEELGNASAPDLPSLHTGINVEEAADLVRPRLSVPVEDQLQWESDSQAFQTWRQSFELNQILVFLLPMGADSARGFSIAHETNPAIAINTHWNTAARTFSLFHELGHILTHTSALCIPGGRKMATEGDERWCEAFAAAVLMPRAAVEAELRLLGIAKGDTVKGLYEPSQVASRFRVSLTAATIRLITLGFANQRLYSAVPKKTDKKSSSGGTGESRAERRLREYGKRTATIFLHGLRREVVSPLEVMRYLDVGYSNLDELQTLTTV